MKWLKGLFGGLLFLTVGAALAHRISPVALKRIFAGFLLAMAAVLAW